MPTIVERETSSWLAGGATAARIAMGLVVVIAATLALVAVETAALAASGLLTNSDLLLLLAQ